MDKEEEKKMWEKVKGKKKEFFKSLIDFTVHDREGDYVSHIGLWVNGETLFLAMDNNCMSWELSELEEKKEKKKDGRM